MSSVARNETTESRPAARPGADLVSRGLLQILWRRQLILLLSIVVCVVTAIIYITQATPIYASSSRISIDNQVARPLQDLIATGGTSGNYLSTQCEIIASSPIVNDAIAKARLNELPSLVNVKDPTSVVRGGLTASVGRMSDIIQVSYESSYAQDCATVVNAVVNAYIANQNEKRASTASSLLKILGESYAKGNAERMAAVQRIQKFRDENPIIALIDTQRGSVVIQKLNTLTESFVREQNALMDAKTSYEGAKALMSDPQKIEQFILNREASIGGGRLNEELQDLQMRRRVLETRGIGADAKVMREIETQMNEIKERIQEAQKRYVTAYVAAMEQNYLATQSKLTDIKKNLEETTVDAVKLQSAASQLKSMYDDLERTNKFLDSLDDKMKAINVNTSDNSASVNIQVLELAQANPNPVRPKKMQVLLISVLLGVMMGFGAALLQDWMDQRLRSVDEISAALQLPILGVVPHIQGGKTAMARGMEVHVEPMSEVSEAYRTIRTAVYFGVPEGQDNTVLVTSPAPGDGKTTMASNLAIAMAQAGHSVLLIDCDFRRPRQHRIFGLKDDVGLSSVLAGQHELKAAVQETAVPNLSLLPCGPIPNNPSEILNSQVFADTIDELKAKYDHVVIDSPPVNPVTDARILAASADVTIIVVRADKSTRKLAENARESLLGVGANLLGVVVNDAPRSGRGYGGYGYGYYSDRLYRDRTSKSRNKSSASSEASSTRA